jgi:hypothetical protein
MATAELADYLQKATGAVIPIQHEGAPVDVAKFPVRIYLGACGENQRLVVTKPLDPEEFTLRTAPGALHVFGGDKTTGGASCGGTLDAVYTFLGDYVGVRWLFSGELGEVVPRRGTLAGPRVDRREQPPVAKRKIRDVAFTRESIFAPFLKQWSLPMDVWKRRFQPKNSPWCRRPRLGARLEIEAGHSYGGYYEKYAKDHPASGSWWHCSDLCGGSGVIRCVPWKKRCRWVGSVVSRARRRVSGGVERPRRDAMS